MRGRDRPEKFGDRPTQQGTNRQVRDEGSHSKIAVWK